MQGSLNQPRDVKFKVDPRPFCQCGRPATRFEGATPLCERCSSPKKRREKIGDYSGKSKSPNAWNDYKD